MILTLGPQLDRTNKRLVAVWERFQQRLENADFRLFLETHTKTAGVIMEAFAPHDLNDPNFCKHRLLEATGGIHVPNGLKKFIRNDVSCGDFGHWYLLVYNIVEEACLAHRCKHPGADTCSQTNFPVDTKIQKRGSVGKVFISLLERLRSAGD